MSKWFLLDAYTRVTIAANWLPASVVERVIKDGVEQRINDMVRLDVTAFLRDVFIREEFPMGVYYDASEEITTATIR